MSNKLLFHNYDVADTSYTYGSLSNPISATKYLTTSGSSTTVSELNAADNVFQGFGVGWIIEVNVDGATTVRTITSVSSAPDSVTVDSAVNWQNSDAGRAFAFRQFANGTGASDGWFDVGNLDEKTLEVYVSTFNAGTSIDVTLEGRITAGPTLQASTIWSKSYTAAAQNDIIPIIEDVDQIRVGFKLTGSDNGTNLVFAYFKGVEKRR